MQDNRQRRRAPATANQTYTQFIAAFDKFKHQNTAHYKMQFTKHAKEAAWIFTKYLPTPAYAQ